MSIVKGVYEDGRPIEYEVTEGKVAIVVTIKNPIPEGEVTVVFYEKPTLPAYIKLEDQQMVQEIKHN